MTRYSTDHKDKTRDAIVSAAAAFIRKHGLDALGVTGIMAEAGLTHGGFYAHFKSRDALLAAAMTRLFDMACDTVDHYQSKYGEAALDRYVDFYLSPRHRDDLNIGCPIPTLSAETRRAAPEVRSAFDGGLDRLADHLGALMPKGGRKAALALLGEMAGTLAVSRAIPDQKQSNDLLALKRKEVLA